MLAPRIIIYIILSFSDDVVAESARESLHWLMNVHSEIVTGGSATATLPYLHSNIHVFHIRTSTRQNREGALMSMKFVRYHASVKDSRLVYLKGEAPVKANTEYPVRERRRV